MKKHNSKALVAGGVFSGGLLAVSAWYTVRFNEARWIVPMDLSNYVFRVQDLPMLIAGLVMAVYLVWLTVSVAAAILANRWAQAASVTRRVDPRLGFLGILGLLGFLGFWTYQMDGTIFPFSFFMFFGFFGFFYEGKLSGTLMDERYLENKYRASSTAHKTAVVIIFLATIFLGQGRLMGKLEYTLIAYSIVVSLALALDLFLGSYLLYRYDHEELPQEEED